MKNYKNTKSNNNDNLLDLVSKQSRRIEELKQENEKLYKELEKYRAQEKEISETLSYAKKQAENIVSEAKIKYALECERIKIYRQKWTLVAANNNKERIIESLEKTFDTLKQCQTEMENMLACDLGDDMKSYIEERDRLQTEPCLNYKAIISNNENKIEELNNNELEELLSQL
jgi:cell division septum initiation protein DivIVA